MIAPPVPAQVRAVLACLPGWFPQAVGWSVRFVNHGPHWLPRSLRYVPLRCMAGLVQLVVQRLQNQRTAAPGYGVKTHGSEAPLNPSRHAPNRKDDPEGSAPDAAHPARTGQNASARPEGKSVPGHAPKI
jgi:hypothetical protein